MRTDLNQPSCDGTASAVAGFPAGARRWSRSLALVFAVCFFAGCRVLGPMPIEVKQQNYSKCLIDSERSQIEIGKPRPIIDRIGWLVGIPDKLLLWDRRVDRHKISEPTILAMADYLEHNNLPHVKVRANQYAPLDDWKRLTRNKTIAWPTRYTLGALSVAGETILPGRVFGGDHFNPFTQTIHLYSDIPAIGLHEAAHAKDFTRRTYQDAYSVAYLFLPLWHETIASEDVFAYLQQRGDRENFAEAHRILYPAYGTYVGGALGAFGGSYSFPIYLAGVAAGHANGRALARNLPETEFPQVDLAKVDADIRDASEDAVRQTSFSLPNANTGDVDHARLR